MKSKQVCQEASLIFGGSLIHFQLSLHYLPTNELESRNSIQLGNIFLKHILRELVSLSYVNAVVFCIYLKLLIPAYAVDSVD
jgi:membrane-anchored glycerophosphoryl diester phosphodiesterase (GDPDase)